MATLYKFWKVFFWQVETQVPDFSEEIISLASEDKT
jgi:cytoplasmic iron level regulating protein YaaA (DUF328/UPF0246 family)